MKTYVIARMYAGAYLDKEIGGEAINLLHDDHGNNYIFVGPYGFIDRRYDDTVEGVVLTRLEKAGVFEVLGIAKIGKGGQVTYEKGDTLKERFENGKAHIREFIKERDIKYGKADVFDVYGADITFASEELLLPSAPIYLTDDHNKNYKVDGELTINLPDKRFPKQSLHAYVTDVDNPKAFDEITSLISREGIWDEGRINKIVDGKVIEKHFSLLDIIRKDFDELSYSNFFGYIFKEYPDVFLGFAKSVLHVEMSSDYEVKREKEGIDLWIEDGRNIIVIENKIKSGINGVSVRHDFSEGKLVQSQLKKYYDYTEKRKGAKEAHYFIFIPNYNKIDLSQYSGSKNYTQIKYSDIYDYFSKVKNEDVYFKEFVNALYKHTKDREIDYAEDMMYRLLQKIRKANA